jgi:hypothetical protein
LEIIRLPKNENKNRRIKIVFATSRLDDELSSIFMPALNRVIKDYGDRVEVHFWGSIPKSKRSNPGFYCHSMILNYDRFLSQFSRAAYDIGLAPLKDDIFHRSKTNNKFREYAACQIAGIYSNVEVYSSCVLDGETGLLVINNTESWYLAIVRLLEDISLREKIKFNARNFVQENYSQENFEKIWLDQFMRVLEKKNLQDKSRHLAGEPKMVRKNFDQQRVGPSPIRVRVKNMLRHYNEFGYERTIFLLRQYIFAHWMSLKFRLLTSFPMHNSNLDDN